MLILLLVQALAAIPALALDLSSAKVFAPSELSMPEKNAVRMLVEEVEKRTQLRWPEVHQWQEANGTIIALGPRSVLEPALGASLKLRASADASAPEGFQIYVQQEGTRSIVCVVGNDARGVLFGVGRLLRELRTSRRSVTLADDVNIASAPKFRLRGHQLGYRPKCNSYDAWDLPVWEQYFRDLAVFGCNTIELIPPRSDDDADSPHFPRPPAEMMVGMSRLADQYGLDVWIWYPAMDKDYSDAKTVESALREWGSVFGQLPRIDAVFVPGGDPGHTPPAPLMRLLEKQTDNLHRYHPKAQMWVSPQGFNQAWLDEFLGILKNEQPAWLTGIVYGPQVRISLARLRERVPAKYPIRHYPDITHSRQCEYPVPDWDVSYAVTEGRECINPRPEGEAAIFRHTQAQTVGFISYSEGCNDDVNKAIWSALAWEPEMKPLDILRQFSRYFIGDTYEDSFAQGLLALEQDWKGPLLSNVGIETTLAQFQEMERTALPAQLKNWRFQQALFRAYYDAYTRRRLLWETELEQQAIEQLRAATEGSVLTVMQRAEQILDRTVTEHTAPDLRARICELAEALFQSIGMQLSVSKYKAIAVDRGASLDTLDYPLSNRRWLKERFAAIRKLSSEPERLAAIEEILHWTDPGPGGFYDDLGNPAQQPHLVQPLTFEQDPERFQSPRADFEEDLVVDEPDEAAGIARRISWMDHMESLYDGPLQMHYSGLDPKAHYKLQAVYGGDNPKRKMRLMANDTLEIHPYMAKPVPFRRLEFAIPKSATERGELKLSWFAEPGLGGNGRSCQVSEVWLIKEALSPKK